MAASIETAPVIGMTTYGRDPGGVFALPADYADAIVRAGGAPVLLPPGEGMLDVAERLDGLILSGGGDLDPASYGETQHQMMYMVDGERDAGELALACHVVERHLPCLCICRGAQVVNVALGGTLIPHLPERVGDGLAHRVPPRRPAFHEVRIEIGSRLAGILDGDHTFVASWHHQAIDVVAPGLNVVARAADGVVEALEMDGHPWLLAVQWHPELTAGHDPQQQALFSALVEAAAVHSLVGSVSR
jgi:putative glutamine amidotransferase